MDLDRLAERLFPDIKDTPESVMKRYPRRELPEGAAVTRMAPSPTGFMHIGNLYGALTDERLAHQSGGVFILRIEDTDRKRTVADGVGKIVEVFTRFGLRFDEGVLADGERGEYGPYRQLERAEIYQTFVKDLVRKGKAYPAFDTEEELAEAERRQTEAKQNPGYYGEFAPWRDAEEDKIYAELDKGTPFVMRFRSEGDPERRIKFTDLVRGTIELPENNNNFVLLKSDGIPTYHFAHIIDDTLMGTTHVVRGEEWLSTLGWHLDMWKTMRELYGWKMPKYIHTAHMLKIEGDSKRKLSKRKDPELALSFYHEQGFPENGLLEYLMTVLNSNYEDWRAANKDKPYTDFPFSAKRMSASGAVFDMAKLLDVCKNTISRMSAAEVLAGVESWAKDYDEPFAELLSADKAYAEAIFAIGRGGAKPRKDFALWSEAKAYMGFFYEPLFEPDYALPSGMSPEAADEILAACKGRFSPQDSRDEWFGRMKAVAEELGYAPDTKLYKQNPSAYRGSVGDVTMALRIAIAGRQNAPDLYDCMTILGLPRADERIDAMRRAIYK